MQIVDRGLNLATSLGVSVNFPMFTHGQQSPIALPPHRSPNCSQLLSDAEDFRLDQDLLAEWYGLEIGHIQRPAHSQPKPEPRFVYQSQRHRRHKVEETGNVSTMGIGELVAVTSLDSVLRHTTSVHLRALRRTGRVMRDKSWWQWVILTLNTTLG